MRVAVTVMTSPDEEPVLDLHHGFPWSRSAPRRVVLPPPVWERQARTPTGRHGPDLNTVEIRRVAGTSRLPCRRAGGIQTTARLGRVWEEAVQIRVLGR